jgi:Glycosyl transferase family 2
LQQPSSDALVSVIVRSMGRPELGRALRSISAQAHRPLEIILVDAGGKGVDPLPKETESGIVVRSVSHGQSLDRPRAANAGMEAAHGQWLLFLDEDDEIAPGHIAELLAAARTANAAVAYSQTRLVDAAGRTQRVFGGPYDHAALRHSNYLAINAVLFAHSLVAAGLRFDETLAIFEDWDFWLQLAERTAFAFTGKPTAIYHAATGQSGAGAGTNLDRETVLAHRIRLMEKWRAKG